MSSKPSLSLPLEIWNKILQQCISDFDLDEQWMSLRLVCSRFKLAVEQSPSRSKIYEATFPFVFQRTVLPYGEEGKFAYFHSYVGEDPTVLPLGPGAIDALRREFKEAIGLCELSESIPNFFKAISIRPFHTISLYNDRNDMPIPGLCIVPDSFDLILDWKALLTRFYGEKRHAERLMGKYKPVRRSCRRACRKATTEPADIWTLAYKAARRARITKMFGKKKIRWSWKRVAKHWSFLEKRKVTDMLCRRRALSVVN
ncbi:hypothetical protein HYFRA_00010393 [Hymenoscyphus fraxineus]|uniref:F-box domain-containing protein n=1 Tax=Hymenoscyphus fraxineus TaxID=746836 RepID=A0A9N9L4S1_9HELO|nr:hypothetical protein HYFRA_00010393 [Hymenoscyphus fraxineus]